ncbi:unnamed protein product [Didymodactylos carnosus]|uniref:Importin alpha n=1 Tax=Didymodactylos carnosus TaxID=1234261 RepID=A0A813P9M3_9BILA|nr:unnamed protein product [Didymodactylos carnosus]CAF1162114.1 unnamed protein product [Didymodactylos carnosus]CAF3531189.1 unnamed protein product [Didymodactylos carnosus]CAF3973761.1 unnamed protein product [Didymodactylos carnosus]
MKFRYEIFDLLKGEFQTQKEAAWCISNLTLSGTSEQVAYVVEQGVISPLCNLLQQQDAQVLQVCLDAVHNILKQTTTDRLDYVTTEIEGCGGLDKIENLQNHPNQDIYQQAFNIIEKYYSTETDEDLSTNGQAPCTEDEFSFSNQTVPNEKIEF